MYILCDVFRYPWIVGLLSGLNIAVVFLTGPLVLLYLAGVLASPKRRYIAAFANAVGTTLGMFSPIWSFAFSTRLYVKVTPVLFCCL